MKIALPSNKLWLCLGAGAVVVAALLVASRFWPSPVGGLSLADLKHDPYLAANPVPAKVEVNTSPPRMTVRYRLGWETKHSRPNKRFLYYDVTGEADGVTPLTLRLVDKGYSHVKVEFRRGDNVFIREYRSIPTAITEDFRAEMQYPRLRREPASP